MRSPYGSPLARRLCFHVCHIQTPGLVWVAAALHRSEQCLARDFGGIRLPHTVHVTSLKRLLPSAPEALCGFLTAYRRLAPLPVPDSVLLSIVGGKEWLWWALCGHPVGVVGFLVASAPFCGLPAFFVALASSFFE
jgi:hypothetical protein